MPAPRERIVLPADALVIKQVLESMVHSVVQDCQSCLHLGACACQQCRSAWLQGIKEYEPRVVHQLLDFMYRNVAEVLEVAKVKFCETTAY